MRRKKEEDGQEVMKRVRPMRCPQCGCRVLDVVGDTQALLFILKGGRNPHFIVKCGQCGIEVGVLKIE